MPKMHDCQFGLGSGSLLPKETSLWGKIRRSCRKLGLVSQHHATTYDHFHSYPEVLAERQRQLYEGSCLAHPFSVFSLSWNTLMVLVNLAHMTLSTFRLFYMIHPEYQRATHACDDALLVLHLLCWLDIFVHFHVGFVASDQHGPNIVLDRRLVASNYVKRWFIWDLVSSLPLAYILLKCRASPRYLLAAHLLPLFRTPRIYTVTVDMANIVKTFNRSYVWHGGLRHAVLFLLTTHWCSCLIYLPTVFSLYWQGKVYKEHHRFLNAYTSGNRTVLDIPVAQRYTKSIFISLSGFFGTGFSLFLASEPDEILLHSMIILYSAMFMVYNFVFLLKVHLTKNSPTVRYQELINQVEEYMRLKQFPVPLKKRVREFYYYRYQEQYYSEYTVLGSLSEGLRNEISLHTCHKLVGIVTLFDGVPASVVGSVLGCLHPEVYMPNDSVLRAGDIGECMYFVANGTVAVYSLKGVEVCHLGDGAHFGEVALLMKDRKRATTVVAVETTQLYRLHVDDFKKFVMSNDLLYERITALASKRMNETVLLDEDFRRKWEHLQETQRSIST